MAGFAAWTRNEGIIFLVARDCGSRGGSYRFRGRPGLPALAPQMLRLIAGLAAPLAVVIFFKLRVGGMGDLFSEKPALVLQHLADPARWIMTAEGLVVVLFTFGRFLIPIVPILALYWYLVRFQVDARDRAGLLRLPSRWA